MRKFILLFCFQIFLLGCSSKYNVEFKEYTSLRSAWLKESLLKGYDAKESYYSILVFTSGFRGEKH